MRDRVHEILNKPEQFLKDNETIIHIKDNLMTALWNDGEVLNEVHGDINEKLKLFLEWLQDENQC